MILARVVFNSKLEFTTLDISIDAFEIDDFQWIVLDDEKLGHFCQNLG